MDLVAERWIYPQLREENKTVESKHKAPTALETLYERIKHKWFRVTTSRTDRLYSYIHSINYQGWTDTFILIYTYFPSTGAWTAGYKNTIDSFVFIRLESEWVQIEDKDEIATLNREYTKMLIRGD